MHYAGRGGELRGQGACSAAAAPVSRGGQAVCPARRRRGARPLDRWVQPELVVEVSFTAWSGDGRVRHAVSLGVREDKPVEEAVMNVAIRRAHAEAGGRS
ncbi:MAG: hypothetical protein ACRYG8_21480 [Janthinobacterium lividum]